MSIMKYNYSFISNNVKRLKRSKEILKQFEYLKNSIGNNGFTFLQEIHSSIQDKKHGKVNSSVLFLFHMGKLILGE